MNERTSMTPKGLIENDPIRKSSWIMMLEGRGPRAAAQYTTAGGDAFQWDNLPPPPPEGQKGAAWPPGADA